MQGDIMSKKTEVVKLADAFEQSFRALKPDKLSASILAMCMEIVSEEKVRDEYSQESLTCTDVESSRKGNKTELLEAV